MSSVVLQVPPAEAIPAECASTSPRPREAAGGDGHDGRGRHLRLVTPPPSRAATWRRRTGALLVVLTLILLLVAAVGRVTASADLQDQVAGHVIIEPGETLWDVAVATAPEGRDPRSQLDAIQDLNGIRASDVDAWTVVLLPAR